VTAIPFTGRGIEAGPRTLSTPRAAAVTRRRWVQVIPKSASLTSLLLACLWALHAAAPSLPGRLYVRLPLLLAIGTALFMRRTTTRTRRMPFAKNGLVAGLGCWLIAASLSAVLNWQTQDVLLTYFVVFVCGAFVYGALSGIVLTRTDLDIAIVGLVIGSLVPLIVGLQTFGTEFGPTNATAFVGAFTDRLRMASYELATFGNRGNTAAFLLIVAPIILAMMLDAKRHWLFRTVCALAMIPVMLNFMIIQVRAGFLTLLGSIVVVWWYKRGARQLPLLAAALVVSWLILFKVEPDAGWMIRDRIVAAITLDTDGDTSVQGRADALQEGVRLAKQHWLLGVGPGAAPTVHSRDSAHQFQINQAMETGFLGFVGTVIFAFAVWICLFRTMVRGRHDDRNDMRFALLIGPASYLTYAVTVNAALSNSTVNTWAILVASMLALMPPFEPRRTRIVRR
jgi:O-Antigen ligase